MRFFTFIVCILVVVGCKKKTEPRTDYAGYPPSIGKILVTHCALAGCHNSASQKAAGSLSLSSWKELFAGAGSNAAIVPFSPSKSPLLFFANTQDTSFPKLSPSMPLGGPYLSSSDIQTLRNWVLAGAPDVYGNVAFPPDKQRKKLYVLNAVCKNVAVIDAATGLVMRYVDLDNGAAGTPLDIALDASGTYWFVVFSAGKLYRYSVFDDAASGSLDLGSGIWRNLIPYQDQLLVVNCDGNSGYGGGEIASVSCVDNVVSKRYSDSLYFPIGAAVVNHNFLYCANYLGNFLYKFDLSIPGKPLISKILIQPGESYVYDGTPYKASCIFNDTLRKKYYVLCEKTAELRVFDANTDQLLNTIPVGAIPQEMAYDEMTHRLFVSCMEDKTSFATGKGSIYVINLDNMATDAPIYPGYQPRGLVLDAPHRILYVANRNADPVGADKPHHYSGCAGNNGYVTKIDTDNLQIVQGYKAEVSADPFSIAFKK